MAAAVGVRRLVPPDLHGSWSQSAPLRERLHVTRLNRPRTVAVDARSGPPRRLLSYVLSAPKRVEDYFEGSVRRRVLWSAISAGAGFYAGNVVTLSFGALAVNDVLAAVVTLLFYEAVSAAFWSASKLTLRLWFANFFKLGLVAATLADALKLGS